jgi:hypothetical protein
VVRPFAYNDSTTSSTRSTDAAAALFALSSVRQGDTVLLQTTAGLVTYRVVALGPKQHLPRALFTREGPPWLAMITCGGRYNPAHGYTRNVVAYAEPVPN